MGEYDLDRQYFHVTNIVKCFPRSTKTPKPKHIDKCARFLKEELKQIDCKLVLVFGNVSRYLFSGEAKGITIKSGQTEWNAEFGVWVCWCTHPSAVLRNRSNYTSFEKGIENFVDKFNLITGEGLA